MFYIFRVNFYLFGSVLSSTHLFYSQIMRTVFSERRFNRSSVLANAKITQNGRRQAGNSTNFPK